MNTLIQEKHNHSESCFILEVFRRTQKVKTYRANETFDLSFSSAEPRNIFGCNVGKDFGILLRGKKPHKFEFAYVFVRIQPLTIYTDLIEYNIFWRDRNSKTAFLLFGFTAKSRGDYNHWT